MRLSWSAPGDGSGQVADLPVNRRYALVIRSATLLVEGKEVVAMESKAGTAAPRSAVEWARIVADWRRSRRTTRESCGARGLTVKTFQWWRWALRARGSASHRSAPGQQSGSFREPDRSPPGAVAFPAKRQQRRRQGIPRQPFTAKPRHRPRRLRRPRRLNRPFGPRTLQLLRAESPRWRRQVHHAAGPTKGATKNPLSVTLSTPAH